MTSLGLIFIGVFCVGLSSIIYPEKDDGGESSTSPVGMILLVISQLFSGGLYIAEEKILGDYYLDPLYIVGWEGVWGVLYYVILLPIL